MKKFAVIVAGGSGSRMSTEIPKQFIEVAGRPILMHTLSVFQKYDSDSKLILVLPENQVVYWKSLCKKYQFNERYELAIGGGTRFQSVKNGLDKISEEGIVFIHDGVRPLVSEQTILRCFKMALEKGNALPVVQVNESVRFSDGAENKSVNRANYFLVQTPQTFRVSFIKKAYNLKYSAFFTDDASVFEKAGNKINLVEGNRENVKITFPEDLKIAEVFLSTNSG